MKKAFLPLLLIANLCFGQVDLNLGLRAYYPFTGNANDVSGNNNNPVFNNATLTADRFGNPNSAYHFNGTSSYMRILNNASINTTNKLSLVAWVKPQGFYAGTCHGNSIMMKGDADYLPGNYLLRFDDGPFTNFNNCSTVMDPLHQNFYGGGANSNPPGYTPYIQTNQWYSVIVTYDGTTAKLYVNCELKASLPQGSATFTNAYDLYLGKLNNASFPYWFNGDMDEVRIYDRALTVDEVNVLGGCVTSGISNIINEYTPVLGFNPCYNTLTVEDGTRYNAGDTVLLIQMKGAVIDSSNTAAFGTITDYKNSGNYEFNYVKSKSGNTIELKNKLTRQYDIPIGKVQLVRVPYYNSVTISDTLTCLSWDGNKGGVLVFNVKDTLTLNADINVSAKGFKGGSSPNSNSLAVNCSTNGNYYPVGNIRAAEKGESIYQLGTDKKWGKAPVATAAGSGLDHNSGGGGGGNGGQGGKGGYQVEGCGGGPFDNGGRGGYNAAYNNASNKIFMGGGGGTGHANNAGGINMNGGNGGGIIIINSNAIIANSYKIISRGANGAFCDSVLFDCNDGNGGGGAGGTILLKNNVYSTNTTIDVAGGRGADLTSFNKVLLRDRVGPGGGGGGGVIWYNASSIPVNVTPQLSGGPNGVIPSDFNNPYGATPGTSGINVFSLSIPVDTVLFQKNIDSVRIKDSLLLCNGFDFKGLAYINSNPIANWQWFFGDGGTANTQNTSHAYASSGTYTVKLIVTDINGCKDSTTKDVTAVPGVVADAGPDSSFCSNTAITTILQGNGNGTYSWTPAIYLNNPTLQNPTATVSTTTVFYLTVTGSGSCSVVDSVTIYVNPLPVVQTLNDTSICKNSLLILTTTPGLGTYNWSPGKSVSDSTIANPVFIDTLPRVLIVTGTNAAGCSARDTINIDVLPLPAVKTIEDTLICSTNTLTLFTGGAQTYSWTPTIFLSNPNIASPVYSGNQSQTYYVTGTGANGCKAVDTVTVNVNVPKILLAPPDKSMCEKSFVQLDGYNGTSVDYLWSPPNYLNNPTIINPVSNTPVSTVYTVKISDRACNYDSTFNVQVSVLPKPIVNAGKLNDIDCANRSAQLFASGGNQYTWSPSTGLNNPNISNPVSTVTNTQKYIVYVSNSAGCSNYDSVTVYADKAASLARYMPNAFTPNGDGLNDCYGLKNWMYIKKLEFRIFNRYGEQVFGTADPSKCWDGYYKGKLALAGSYVFYIKAETSCGTEEQKGNFFLIR